MTRAAHAAATLQRRHTRPLGELRRAASASPEIIPLLIALIAAGAVIWSVELTRLDAVPGTFLPWWGIAIGYALTSAVVAHVHLRRDAYTIAFDEVPLVLGLTLAAPLSLFAGAFAGTLLSLKLYRRQPTVKLVFNLGSVMVASGLTVALYRGLLGDAAPLSVRGWLAMCFACQVVTVLTTPLVPLAMHLTGDRVALRGLPGLLVVQLPAAFLTTICGLGTAHLVVSDRVASVVVVVPLFALIVAYRRYLGEREERTHLSLLYESSRLFANARDLDSVVTALLGRAQEMLRADRAELMLLPTDSDGDVMVLTVTAGDPARVDARPVGAREAAATTVGRRGRLVPRGTDVPDEVALLQRLGARDAVIAPLVGDATILGTVLVADRHSDVATFVAADLALLETFASHAAGSISTARLEAELHDVAYHDTVTGLSNRALVARRVHDAVAGATPERPCAVFCLDLDDFKTTNDSLGQVVGDRILSEVGRRLLGCVGPVDVVGRLGGDEFAVVLEDVSGAQQAVAVARRMLDALREPLVVSRARLRVTASIGIVLCEGEEITAGDMLARADVAMYHAKAHGKARYELFEPGMLTLVQERHRLRLELERALHEGGISVQYQPVVDLVTGTPVGVEALARWPHREMGMISPTDFIPLAEECGLIADLGAHVLRIACRQLVAWRQVAPELCLAVNVSGVQLRRPGFPDEVARILRETGIDPRALTLEVTETVMVAGDDVQTRALDALSALGLQLAIDDFGTGYSSLSSLQELPVQVLKIAKPFVDGITAGPRREAFGAAIVALGQTLGMSIIAEGIETAAQAERLIELRCPYGQGFLYAPPLEATTMTRLLSSRRPALLVEPDPDDGEPQQPPPSAAWTA